VQRQLTLDLGTPPLATFDNFFAAGNHELVTRLRELEGALASGPVADRTFYVWGEAGSGRSHLLQAVVHEAIETARGGRPVLIGTDSVAESEALSRRLAQVNQPHAVLT